MKYLPKDAHHQVYIIDNKDNGTLEKFTEDYQPEGYSRERVNEAREALKEVIYQSQSWFGCVLPPPEFDSVETVAFLADKPRVSPPVYWTVYEN